MQRQSYMRQILRTKSHTICGCNTGKYDKTQERSYTIFRIG